jgi:hypothetical protein
VKNDFVLVAGPSADLDMPGNHAVDPIGGIAGGEDRCAVIVVAPGGMGSNPV